MYISSSWWNSCRVAETNTNGWSEQSNARQEKAKTATNDQWDKNRWSGMNGWLEDVGTMRFRIDLKV